MFIPTKAFLTKGVGRHKEKLTSFEMALRDAHLANFNLVRVSSIFPPQCELVDREEGMSMLKPGQVVFAVIAESATNEPSRLVSASIGVAMPADASHHGYISEHHSYGQSESVSGEYAEDLAASDGAAPRPVVRRRVFPRLRAARRGGVRRRTPAARLSGVAGTRGRCTIDFVRDLSPRGVPAGVADA